MLTQRLVNREGNEAAGNKQKRKNHSVSKLYNITRRTNAQFHKMYLTERPSN